MRGRGQGPSTPAFDVEQPAAILEARALGIPFIFCCPR